MPGTPSEVYATTIQDYQSVSENYYSYICHLFYDQEGLNHLCATIDTLRSITLTLKVLSQLSITVLLSVQVADC